MLPHKEEGYTRTNEVLTLVLNLPPANNRLRKIISALESNNTEATASLHDCTSFSPVLYAHPYAASVERGLDLVGQ
jgi:hypothetical protein